MEEYASPWNAESLEVFGLAVVFGFSLLSGSILLIALTALLIGVFHRHTTPKREEKAERHEFML